MNRVLLQPAPLPEIRGEFEFTLPIRSAKVVLEDMEQLALQHSRLKLPKIPKDKVLPVSVKYQEKTYDTLHDKTYFKFQVCWGRIVDAPNGRGAPAHHRGKRRIA